MPRIVLSRARETFQPFLRAALFTGPFLVVCASSLTASPIGLLQVTVDETLTLGSLDPSSTGAVDPATTLTYDGGTSLSPATPTTVKDLTFATVPLSDFLTFTGIPDLTADVTGLDFPAVTTACSSLTVVGESCIPVAGSPILLTAAGTNPLLITGTTVSIDFSGTAKDTLGASIWGGNALTNVPGALPSAVQSELLSGTFPSGGYDIDLTARAITTSAVPEPGTLTLTALGLIGVVRRYRRRRTAR